MLAWCLHHSQLSADTAANVLTAASLALYGSLCLVNECTPMAAPTPMPHIRDERKQGLAFRSHTNPSGSAVTEGGEAGGEEGVEASGAEAAARVELAEPRALAPSLLLLLSALRCDMARAQRLRGTR